MSKREALNFIAADSIVDTISFARRIVLLTPKQILKSGITLNFCTLNVWLTYVLQHAFTTDFLTDQHYIICTETTHTTVILFLLNADSVIEMLLYVGLCFLH